MIWVTHLAFGALCFILLSKYLGRFNIIALIVCLVASLLPDCDHSKSKIGKKIPIIPALFTHRGPIHSLLITFILFFIVLFILKHYSQPFIYAFAFLIGYLSHLAIDSLNPQGVLWFYPSKLRIRSFIKTGGLFEKVTLALIFLAIIYFAYKGVNY